MKYAAKLHQHNNCRVLAACDEELLGKTFSDGKKLKLTVKTEFYSGEKPVSRAELESLMKQAEILNLVGEGVIGVAEGLGMGGSGSAVLRIGGVPHLQILKVKQHGDQS